MLTTTSGIPSVTGYQIQLDTSTSRPPSTTQPPFSNRQETDDTVNISRKAKDLQQDYQKKKTIVEQNYTSDKQQLERAYHLEKNKLERELNQKKQALEINTYA
ncbi:hypothetical protein [Desulfobacula sp.]|uniref:hypothetical protein n=1 Tax=Desulfobacula sp. TaxID=2593537 RepID=UPI00260CEA2C|nr:hypothetical protein [Desulfobacula sp.]